MNDLTIQAAYKICHDIMKNHSKNFFHAFKNISSRRFQYIQAIYAFCRYVDDVTDIIGVTSPEKAIELLTGIKSEIQTFYIDKVSYKIPETIIYQMDWFPAFIDTLQSIEINPKYFFLQIDGQLADLNFSQPVTESELIDYSEQVAGSVGLMLMPMLVSDNISADNPLTIDACNQLGLAMQITNILRDIGEDCRERNRVYIPIQIMDRFEIDEQYIISQANNISKPVQISTSFIKMLEYLAQNAENMYANFLKAIEFFDVKCQFSMVVAALNYRGILDAVRHNHYDCLTTRCYTNKKQQESALLEAQSIIDKMKRDKMS